MRHVAFYCLPQLRADYPRQGESLHHQAGETPLVIAHRGGRNLAPENTLVAFDNAVAMGVDVLEMDVCVTADGIAVTLHDLTIDRTSDGSGDVSTFTFEELQAFNFGAKFRALNGTYPYADVHVPIPSVEQIFARHPNQLMEIEIKSPGALGRVAARELVRLIEAYGMARKVIVFSFFDDVMQYYRSVAPGISLSEPLWGKVYNLFQRCWPTATPSCLCGRICSPFPTTCNWPGRLPSYGRPISTVSGYTTGP